jgi:hAT family C-terminal dimerisation region
MQQMQVIQVNRSEFPTLYAIALDYLPIQASSVPCERVFSSAKDTDTAKRNRIHPMLMEVLQTLKFSLKKDRHSMSFTNGWTTRKGDMAKAQELCKEDLLVHLVTGDSQATTDALLKIFDDDTDDDTDAEVVDSSN